MVWHGPLGSWVPFIQWFLWLAVLKHYMIRDIHRQLRNLDVGPLAKAGTAASMREPTRGGTVMHVTMPMHSA